MIAMLLRKGLLLSLVLFVAGGSFAFSDGRDDNDHEQAHRALQGGHALPLASILREVGQRFDGDVVGVEFEREGGRYVYELKIVSPDGRLREVYVDARTAEIISDETD
jgi:uncharacterized membrane protein YkoI